MPVVMPPPHRWNGERWTCTVCGHVSPDPCDCRCHDLDPAEVKQ